VHVTFPSLPHAASASDSIVGLWHVTCRPTVVFNESFDTRHRDGAEYDNVYLPPLGSSSCEAVWKLIGPRTVRLASSGVDFLPGWNDTPWNLHSRRDQYDRVKRNDLQRHFQPQDLRHRRAVHRHRVRRHRCCNPDHGGLAKRPSRSIAVIGLRVSEIATAETLSRRSIASTYIGSPSNPDISSSYHFIQPSLSFQPLSWCLFKRSC
jgi:hypothetical protein